jgi:quercetin dioxygenase-like cupin family protein
MPVAGAHDATHRATLGAVIDYGLPAVSGGVVRAIATRPDHFAALATWTSAWHYHDCDLQLAAVIAGSIDVSFEADKVRRAAAGDLLFIPGGVVHDARAPSADYQVAEITFPGSFATTACEAPPAESVSAGLILAFHDAQRMAYRDGVARYAYPVPPAFSGRLSIERHIRSRADPLTATWNAHRGRMRITYVLRGSKRLEVAAGDPIDLEALDVVLVPDGVACFDASMSDDFDALEILFAAG